MGNVFGGLLTVYLVAAGWLTARRKEAKTGFLEFAVLLLALREGVGGLIYGCEAAISSTALM